MDNLFRRFLVKIGVKDLAPYASGSFSKLQNDKFNNRIIAEVHFPTYLHHKDYQNLFDIISEFVSRGGFGIDISFKYDDEEVYFTRLLEEFKTDRECFELEDVAFIEGGKKVVFYYEATHDVTSTINEARLFCDFLDSISSTYVVMTQERVFFEDDYQSEREQEAKRKGEEAFIQIEREREIQSHYQPCKLKDIEKYRMVEVQAKIFAIPEEDIRKTKKGKTMMTLYYSDGTDSISSVLFESKRFPLEKMKSFHVGDKIRVFGKTTYDSFRGNRLTISIDSIEVLPPDHLREDTYPRKRVELHAHSNRSDFDGVAAVEDYISAASRWGHRAFAITDHANVQDYPDVIKAAKKAGLKVLYGIELYVVDDHPVYIYNPKNIPLRSSDTIYVVFDLETTGLSARYDRIIEFGAVKMNGYGQILDSIDFFVRPEMKLSEFSMKISHITQEMADSGRPIKQALNDILEFFGDDAILVGHNVAFDYGFLNEALKNNGMKPIENAVIDTLPLARVLYPDFISHREGYIARQMGIEFDEINAHRANYDAEMLGKIFEIMLSRLADEKKGIVHSDLNEVNYPIDIKVLKSMHPSHVTVYIKDQEGVRDLYEIVSRSNIEWMSNHGLPLVPKSYLSTKREHLLFGSACFNGEVFEAAMTKSKEDVVAKMKFYDFIEVQPPENYIYLVHRGQVRSKESILEILKDLIYEAKAQKKLVCATGDCHYVNPEDKIFRDIYISAKGLKGARHPLNLAPREGKGKEAELAQWYKNPLPNPDQHFRTTDEMVECFSFLEDKDLIEEIVIDNTNKVADMISTVKPLKEGLYPPYIPGADDNLRELTFKTAKELYGDPLPQVIQERLDTELKGIIENGYGVIYWLSSEIVRWSNSEGYMIGSRGSVGSSLVATMSGITEVNPLPPHYRCPRCKYLEWADIMEYDSGFDLPAKKCPHCGADLISDGQNIPFATFLGFHAEKVPDIDLNFPSDFQSTAHEHMKKILNETGNHCYKAGTIQKTQDRQARGYVLGYFESLGIDKANVRDEEIMRLAIGCTDVKRSTGQHPGGVIVIPKGMEAYDFTPVQYPAGDTDASWETTHFDFRSIHDNVLKFDMLGHVDPQAVKMQCDFCNFSFMDMKEKIEISDPEAKSLFWSAEALHLKNNVLEQETGALGLPEFGTENGRRVLLETQPKSFSDLVRISGLSHGTNVFAGNAEDLILEKGFKLKDVIACRDDIMTVLHDKYGVDNTDAFAIMEFTRKGNFGKEGNDDKKQKFDAILREHNVPDWYIDSCHKIAYMFPKGHAVAYVTNCVRCAWFKVHQPLSYYATYFTLRCDSYDIGTMMKGIQPCLNMRNDILRRKNMKLSVSNTELQRINAYESTIEMYDRGYTFRPISVVYSDATKFTPDYEHNAVVPALTCIDGLGASVAEQIVAARNEHPFTSIEDLRYRAKIGESMIDKLREVGALDDLPESDQMTLF